MGTWQRSLLTLKGYQNPFRSTMKWALVTNEEENAKFPLKNPAILRLRLILGGLLLDTMIGQIRAIRVCSSHDNLLFYFSIDLSKYNLDSTVKAPLTSAMKGPLQQTTPSHSRTSTLTYTLSSFQLFSKYVISEGEANPNYTGRPWR